ncbi:MAG TPA: UbiX family flavin prenyltransferase [Chloroflexi bacterium]|nr:UbiX family flavin prenyltransferase [Chloroflexota bacterium]
MNAQSDTRLIIGISGASGACYGVRLLEVLQQQGVETHLVLTEAARLTLKLELNRTPEALAAGATRSYAPDDLAAPIASGSFAVTGMIVAPCSIKSLSAIAHSHTDDLLSRAADVTLKEGRPLVLVVRETPLHLGHLRLMAQAAEIGAVIFPPVPTFYTHPQTVQEIIDQTVGRVLARVGIPNALFTPWAGGA